jgi:hypothetical protein
MVQELGKGTLNFNRDKKTDRHPDVFGRLTMNDGTVMNVAGWNREGQYGSFISLVVSEHVENKGTSETTRTNVQNTSAF